MSELTRLGPLRVTFGDPIEIGDLVGLPIDDAAREATDRLSIAITELEASLA
jgi:beta-lactam-binding protein with PASTA domain